MPASILIAYATRYGSTQEVAEVVAATLQEQGLEVDSLVMRKVRTLEQYRAVVLGAPLYMFHWHKDARRFLARHPQDLTARSVVIFALGPFHAEEQEYQASRDQLAGDLAKFPWLKPETIAMFGGKFDAAKLTFPYNLMPALRRMPASDVRDWPVIRAWAAELAERLQATGAATQ